MHITQAQKPNYSSLRGDIVEFFVCCLLQLTSSFVIIPRPSPLPLSLPSQQSVPSPNETIEKAIFVSNDVDCNGLAGFGWREREKEEDSMRNSMMLTLGSQTLVFLSLFPTCSVHLILARAWFAREASERNDNNKLGGGE
jgi:hypothetical protein